MPGVALLDGATQALAWLTEYGASPVLELATNVLGLGADGLDALSGNYSGESHSPWAQDAVDKFNAWIEPLREKAQGIEQEAIEGAQNLWRNALGLPANEAQDKLQELTEDATNSLNLINQTKDAMNSTDDPEQIRVYKKAIADWQTELNRTLVKIRQIKSAMGGKSTGGSYSSSPKNKGEAKMVPFADGGIVTRPTIGLIGEAGEKEAVIPLSKLGSVIGQVSRGSVTYAPVIQISGNADEQGVRRALGESYAQFKANWQRLQKEQRRAAF